MMGDADYAEYILSFPLMRKSQATSADLVFGAFDLRRVTKADSSFMVSMGSFSLSLLLFVDGLSVAGEIYIAQWGWRPVGTTYACYPWAWPFSYLLQGCYPIEPSFMIVGVWIFLSLVGTIVAGKKVVDRLV